MAGNRGTLRMSGPQQPGNFPWLRTINAIGALAVRPPASWVNAGFRYLATDQLGGTEYESNGAIWQQVTYGLNVSANNRVLGATTAGPISELTLSNVLDMIGSPTRGDILFRGASQWTRLPGSSLQFLQSNGSTGDPAWIAASAIPGVLAQVPQRQDTGTLATGTTTVTINNSVPGNTQGDQYLTKTITPTKTGNLLWVQAQIQVSNTNGSSDMMAMLYQDSGSALVTSWLSLPAANFVLTLYLCYRTTAAGTSATTFKVRAGGNVAGTTTLNGSASTQYFGGTLNSFLEITEWAQ